MANANVVTWAGRSIYNGRLKALGTEPLNVGWGTSADTASAFTDVALFASSNLEARAVGTSNVLTANQLADTYVVVGTLTANGAKGITEVGLFDTATSLSPMTTLSVLLSSAVTSMTVAGNISQALPTAGNFYAQIDNEVVLVTGGQGTSTLTITRGALGSTSTSHVAGAVVTAGGDGGAHAANASIGGETWGPTGANGGSMFVHADFPVINLSNNDSIQFTLKVQLQ